MTRGKQYSGALWEGVLQSMEPIPVLVYGGRFPRRILCRITGHKWESMKCSKCGARLEMRTFAEIQSGINRDFASISGINDIGKPNRD